MSNKSTQQQVSLLGEPLLMAPPGVALVRGEFAIVRSLTFSLTSSKPECFRCRGHHFVNDRPENLKSVN